MASIEGYRSDIRDYYEIKDKLRRIADSLDSASRSAGHLSNEVTGSYKINNAPTVITSRIDTLKGNINEEINHIHNVIIPSIDDEISYCESEIDRLEEEERRRREEEEEDGDD